MITKGAEMRPVAKRVIIKMKHGLIYKCTSVLIY